VPRNDEFKQFCLPPALPTGANELMKKFNDINPEAEDDEVRNNIHFCSSLGFSFCCGDRSTFRPKFCLYLFRFVILVHVVFFGTEKSELGSEARHSKTVGNSRTSDSESNHRTYPYVKIRLLDNDRP
jgi:hypothetical protein